mgnify:CR=1 FL=1
MTVRLAVILAILVAFQVTPAAAQEPAVSVDAITKINPSSEATSALLQEQPEVLGPMAKIGSALDSTGAALWKSHQNYLVPKLDAMLDPVVDSVRSLGTASWKISSETAGGIVRISRETVEDAVRYIVEIPQMQIESMTSFVARLRSGDMQEFSELTLESGFVLEDVALSFSIIPRLEILFTHQRNLTEEERASFNDSIDAYFGKRFGPAAYFERSILEGLLRAGEVAAVTEINEVKIGVLPLPGLTIGFDPLGFVAKEDKMLSDSFTVSAENQTKIDGAIDRISLIEDRLKMQ